MAKISINTAQKVIPMIYAYSTPEIARHDGWVKIGYTEKQTTEQRQKQQSHTIDVELKETLSLKMALARFSMILIFMHI